MSAGGQVDVVPEPGEFAGDIASPPTVRTETRTPQDICTAYGSPFAPPAPLDKVAVALNTLGQPPLNARRVSPERGTCGWYIWGGEGGGRSRTPGFFQTLPVAHLIDRCPRILPFLALAPGWRVRIAADGPEIKPPHNMAPPANIAARRIGSRTSPPPSVKQWVWLSILLHILAVALFGDTTGGGTRRGEHRGDALGGPMTVTLQGPVDRGVDAPLRRTVNTSSRPQRREAAEPAIRAASPPKNAVPAGVDSPTPSVPATPEDIPDATVMPPVIATEVDKPVTNFVVPIMVPVVIPDPPEPPTPPEPEAIPPSLPRLNAIVLPKVIDPPTIERDIALPAELIPRLKPLAPARAERENKVPVEVPRLKTFVAPRIEPEVVAPPIQMPRMAPLAPLPPPRVERETVRPAELLPRLPPVTPAAPIDTVTPTAPVPRVAQPTPPAPVVADHITEPARVLPPAMAPSAPIHTSPPPLVPSASRDIPGVPDGAGAAQDTPAAAPMPRAPSPPATGNAPRIDLDAVRQRARELAREGSGPRTLLPFNVRPKEEIRKKEQQAFDKALKRPDCRDAYSGMGLAAVVPLLWDSVSEKGCKW